MATSPLIGARIRRQRLDRGLKQSHLARACGISPSYLNLIEHGRRSIGGKLMADLAHALDVPPEQLSAGVEAADLARLRGAAAALRGPAAAEVDRADEFALRFPGWAGLVLAQAERSDTLERRLDVMADRMRRDPVLAASLHNILSTVTAIRSTAGILAGDDPVEPAWQSRFHRNLYEESQRLADATAALVDELEGTGTDGEAGDPVEAAEAFLGTWEVLGELEGGPGGRAAVLQKAEAAVGVGAAYDIIRGLVDDMVADAAALPISDLRAVMDEGPLHPFHLADRFDLRLPLILRRMAALPELGAGFVRTDGEGAVVLRRQIPGFTVPRYGAARLLWPLYAALENPGRAEAHRLGPPDRAWEQCRVWAIAEGQANGSLRGTMLILPELVPT